MQLSYIFLLLNSYMVEFRATICEGWTKSTKVGPTASIISASWSKRSDGARLFKFAHHVNQLLEIQYAHQFWAKCKMAKVMFTPLEAGANVGGTTFRGHYRLSAQLGSPLSDSVGLSHACEGETTLSPPRIPPSDQYRSQHGRFDA
jgi:hypothetical protein